MQSILNAILDAPLPNLLIVAGLIFVGLAVVGGISGKIEPDRQGRVASGIVGVLLLASALYLVYGAVGLPQAAQTAATTPLEAPLPNLLIIGGLIFIGIAVAGGVSGKFEPDRLGRIGSGFVGGGLVLFGFYLIFSGTGQSLAVRVAPPPPALTAPAVSPATTVAPAAAAPSPAATAVAIAPVNANTPAPAASATALTTLPSNSAAAVSATPTPRFVGTSVAPPPLFVGTSVAPSPLTTFFKVHREAAAVVAPDRTLVFSDTWTVAFGANPPRQFGVTIGSLQDVTDFWATEGDLRLTESSARGDHSFEVQRVTNQDGSQTYTILWYFPATANQSRTFGLGYTLHGFVRDTSGGLQLLTYNFYGGGGGPVGSEHLTFKLQRAYEPSQLSAQTFSSGVEYAGARIVDGQTVEVSAQNLPSNTLWGVQIRYPAP